MGEGGGDDGPSPPAPLPSGERSDRRTVSVLFEPRLFGVDWGKRRYSQRGAPFTPFRFASGIYDPEGRRERG